jgi:hypothetical protein
MSHRCSAWMFVVTCAVLLGGALVARAQLGVGTFKGFRFPEYEPTSNGVKRLKTLVTGTEARLVTNGVFAVSEVLIQSFGKDGTSVLWTATSPACVVSLAAKEARGHTNVYFRTADERLFQSGVGFLWQQTNSLLIFSNQAFTWIDRQAMTNRGILQP